MTTYRDAVIARLDKQINKGKAKYGMTLEDNTQLTMTERHDHLAEELIDGLQYIEHLKALEAERKPVMESLLLNVNNLGLMAIRIKDPMLKVEVQQQVAEINRLLKELHV